MRRFAIMVMTLTFVAAACGDDDTAATTSISSMATTQPAAATTSTTAPASTSSSTTTSSTTTTTEVPAPTPTVDTAPIVTDLPVVDGSTSTQPLRMLLLCGLADVQCEWMSTDLSWHSLVVVGGAEDPSTAALVSNHVPTSGTHGSYSSLIAGESDLIIVARAPSDDEAATARAAGVEFHIRPVALDAFVFLVNDANPVGSLALDEIRDIYTGGITDWSDVGGADGPIQPYQRNESSGSQELMKRLVMGDRPMIDAPDWMLGISMMAPFTMLSSDAAGIGYSVYYYAANMQPLETVSMIAIEGVVPSVSSIADGSYPLVTEVFAVVRASDDGSGRVLMDWLGTADGQAAIEATGYVPLP